MIVSSQTLQRGIKTIKTVLFTLILVSTSIGVKGQSVSNPAAVNITTTGARIQCSYDLGSAASVVVRYKTKLSSSSTWPSYSNASSNGVDYGYKDLTGLPQSTTYNYFLRVQFYDEEGVLIQGINSDTLSFSTLGASAPTTQATTVNITPIGTTTATVSWTNGNGTNRILVARATTDAEVTPTNGIEYAGNAAFGSAPTTGTGNRVVYSGTGTTVNITGLTSGVNYTFKVYEYNGTGTGTLYNTSNSTGNPNSASTLKGEPTVQANNVSFGTVTSNSMVVNWVRGDAVNNDGCIVVVKASGAIGNFPVDGTDFANPQSAFGTGDQVYDNTGEYVVYKGTGTAVTITNLTPGTAYHVRVFEYNNSGANINYNINTGTDNPDFTTTAYVAPSTQATNVTIAAIGSTTATVSWTNGNGAQRILVARATSNAEVAPTNGIEYTGNPVFGSAPTTGTGNRVVYSGTGSIVNITGLTTGVNYTFKVYEYNGTGTGTVYNTANSTGNPVSQSTSNSATWYGNTSTDWSVATNWSSATVPNASTLVTIPSNPTRFPTLSSGNGYASSISIASGSSLTISNTGNLAIGGNITVNSGAYLIVDGNSATVSIGGDLTLESSGNANACGQLVINGNSSFSVSGTSTLTKGVQVNRNFLMSCPITTPDIMSCVGHYVYKWNESSTAWVAATQTTPVSVMEGLNVVQDAGAPSGNFIFSGIFNNGGKSRSITNANPSNPDGATETSTGWNLIGNPYPCAIDLEAAGLSINEGTGGGTFYFYPGSTNWSTYNPTTNASNNGGTQYVAAMQGFFFYSHNSSGSVGFANSMRVANSKTFYKEAQITYPTVKIALKTELDTVESTVVFYEGATPEFDHELDALIFPGSIESEASHIALLSPKSTKMAVNTYDINLLNQGNINLYIPLEIKTTQTGNITLYSPMIEQIPNNINVYLFDGQENTYTNLRTSNYTGYLAPSTYTRYSLVLSSTVLSTDDTKPQSSQIFSYQNQIYLYDANGFSSETMVNIFEISGRKIHSESIQGVSSKTYNLSEQGVYIVQLINASGTLTKKVFVE